MESINYWTKLLPLNQEGQSLQAHFPNFVVANQCDAFEQKKCVQNSFINGEYQTKQCTTVPEIKHT